MKRMFWCTLFTVMCVVASPAQSIRVPESWDKLAAKADEVVNIKMDRKMLQFAAKFMDDSDKDDAEGKQLISKLSGIYVRSLEFKVPVEITQADVEPIRQQLQGPEWSRMVDVESKSDKEKTTVYVKVSGSETVGMVILVEGANELTFVDLEGPINPEDIGELSGTFGIPKGIHSKSRKATTPQQTDPTAVKK